MNLRIITSIISPIGSLLAMVFFLAGGVAKLPSPIDPLFFFYLPGFLALIGLYLTSRLPTDRFRSNLLLLNSLVFVVLMCIYFYLFSQAGLSR